MSTLLERAVFTSYVAQQARAEALACRERCRQTQERFAAVLDRCHQDAYHYSELETDLEAQARKDAIYIRVALTARLLKLPTKSRLKVVEELKAHFGLPPEALWTTLTSSQMGVALLLLED